MIKRAVTIIVPIYADWPSLGDCIDSLKRYVHKRHRVILVNDVGPDVELMERNIQVKIKGLANFVYYRNPNNLGFVRTCNRAVFELDKTNNDILLLNSDTKVTDGFLEEMLAVLYSNDKIGAVSPRSNNATIATVPIWAMARKGIEPKKSYQIFNQLKLKLPRFSQVPTAHGFCMLIRRSFIKKYGLFDEVFGRGYGEEVDFCQRIKAVDKTCVLSNRAFVYHLEARSFGATEKLKLIEQSTKIIKRRYPDYQASVHDYVTKASEIESGLLATKSDNLKKLVKKNQLLEKLAHKIHRRLIRTL